MPGILGHQSAKRTKMILLGNSGTGKTGALFSLARAGYNLRILDLDNGCDILKELTLEEIRKNPSFAEVANERIIYESVGEKMKNLNGVAVPDGIPKQMATAMNLLTHWKLPERKDEDGSIIPAYDLGPIGKWTSKDILVIDSLSRLSDAAMRHVLSLNGRPAGPKQQSDWGTAMDMVEGVLALLYSDQVPCNVIVIAHIVYLTNEDAAVTQAFPNTLGQKLPPKIPSYFNTMVLAKTKGTGAQAKRTLITQPEGLIEVKIPTLSALSRELPVETGLATIFAALQRGLQTPAPAPAQPVPSASLPAKTVVPAG